MLEVIIDGIEYVPKAQILEATDERFNDVLEVLTEMRYFNEEHKMMRLAWNAINAISPELARLDPEVAYYRIHGPNE